MESLLNRSLGGLALILFSPIIFSISLLVQTIDGRPIFFRQKRLGRKKREFMIFKFRTMKDDKVTKLGAWLRKTGLDELPQIFNIIIGQMNAVGPRPITIDDAKRFGYTQRFHLKRWTVNPGITGLSQIKGFTDTQSSFKADIQYIAQRSFWFDVRIILVTLCMNLIGKRLVRSLANISAHT